MIDRIVSELSAHLPPGMPPQLLRLGLMRMTPAQHDIIMGAIEQVRGCQDRETVNAIVNDAMVKLDIPPHVRAVINNAIPRA